MTGFLLVTGLGTGRGQGQEQVRLDVFLGLDGYIPSHGWFPVACEVQNNGPTFMATFEVSVDNFASGGNRRMQVELPTGTLKRFAIPFHASGPYIWRMSARLLDERGDVRAEAGGLNIRRQVHRGIPLAGAVGTWAPPLAKNPNENVREEYHPVVARMLTPLFPENPILLEGLDSLYLGSDRALELNDGQIAALLAWMQSGGHLLVGIKQVNHLNGAEWLENRLPMEVTNLVLDNRHEGLHTWLVGDLGPDGESLGSLDTDVPWQASLGRSRNGNLENPYKELPLDQTFATADLERAVGRLRDGKVIAGSANTPLIVSAPRGRGRLTMLNFDPEQAAVRDWVHEEYFWHKLTQVPPGLLSKNVQQYVNARYQSSDGAMASMVDSHQVRKLPVGWLLVLLVGYLVVIGPLDRMWLKKINRQMLTWLTFPAYVALFSLLIYFIGYKLRAGETEWNQLHMVDILPQDNQAQVVLHGWSYGSLYSPVNARYQFASKEDFAAFRAEFGPGAPSRHTVRQQGNNFLAEASVPVWTSQLFVSDWWRRDLAPLQAELAWDRDNGVWKLTVENRGAEPIEKSYLVLEGKVMTLEGLLAGEKKTMTVQTDAGESLSEVLRQYGQDFLEAIQRRRNPLQGNAWEVIADRSMATVAASFGADQEHRTLLEPLGQDLSGIASGRAVFLAWMPGHAPTTEPINQFEAKRTGDDTLWRVVLSLPAVSGSAP